MNEETLFPEVEIMAPAGSYESLSAAIRAGADSVYFGVDRLNMRSRSASPFKLDDLRRIARLCRRCGVRSYLALNVIVYDDEIADMQAVCDAAREAGITAVIATDLSAIRYARSIGLEVHISTQANISNFEAVKFYAQYADVVVLARELSLEQIEFICRRIREENICGPSGRLLQVELFVHGALCVAISGKCYMSLGQYNSSGNRGACFQPCRRRYRVTDEETGEELVLENQFVMSPKDLCTVQYLNRIVGAGVQVLKLEGRGRSADYVATVTSVYRAALDNLKAAVGKSGGFPDSDAWPSEDRLEEWMRQLRNVFNRGFWDGGYYCGEKLGEWATASNSSAETVRVQLGRVSNYFSKLQVAEFKCCQPELKPGDRLLVIGPTTGAVEFDLESLRVGGDSAGKAGMGDLVTVPVPVKIRKGDKVFLLKERSAPGARI